MYEYISGEIKDISPSFVVLDNNGIGYFISISLNTYEKIRDKKNIILFVYQVLREDTNDIYGFADKNERQIFKLLISVSGIGANTARLMLSSLTTSEITSAIVDGDVAKIKSVKGIGLKTAQRVIVDLKDKVSKNSGDEVFDFGDFMQTDIAQEAISALTMLGFNKKQTEKYLTEIIRKNKNLSVEDLVKLGIRAMSK